MYLNRFCIDENAAFELYGVLYLEKSSDEIINGDGFKHERISKGKGVLITLTIRACRVIFGLLLLIGNSKKRKV